MWKLRIYPLAHVHLSSVQQLWFCAFRNAKKICTYSICTFIWVYVEFRSNQTKSRFILIFRPNRVKSQFFFEVWVQKCDLEVEFVHDFLHSCLGQKNKICHKKFEFFDKGWIKYEFLTRLKLKTPKHQPKNQIYS